MKKTALILLTVAFGIIAILVALATNDTQPGDAPLRRDSGAIDVSHQDDSLLAKSELSELRSGESSTVRDTPFEESISSSAPSAFEPEKTKREEVDEYREETIVQLLGFLCEGEGGKRWVQDTPQAQAQFLLVHAIAVLLDDLGRGEVATGPYTVPDPETGERVFSVNGIIYRFQSSEYPVWDQFMEHFTNPETGDPVSLSPVSPDLPELGESIQALLCERGRQALLILENY